jgi:RecA-family ATPase
VQQAQDFSEDRTINDESILERLSPLDWMNPPTNTAKTIIPDIVNAGQIVSLVGQGGTGKSLLMLDIAMAMATGQSVLGHPPDEPMSVLYIDMENPIGEVFVRRANLGYQDNTLEGLKYYHMPDLPALDTKSGGQFIQAMVNRHSPDLVIFDTISKLVAGEESKSDTWQDLYKYSLVPLRQTNCAALILDHQGHDASRGARGSSAKRDNVDLQWIQTCRDGLIILKRDKCRTLHATETLTIRRGGTPLRHTTETDAVQDCITFLDSIGFEGGRQAAQGALIVHNRHWPRKVLEEALRQRKTAQAGAARNAA